jgi:hypothetical protein
LIWLWLFVLVLAFLAISLLIRLGRRARARRVVTDFDDLYRERLMKRVVEDEIHEAFDALDDIEPDWD